MKAQRRRDEVKAVRQLDTTSIASGESWYLIHSPWIQSWHDFKEGSPIVPGPITNTELLIGTDEQMHVPKPNLKTGRDYRALNGRVWQLFNDTYGGGPPIVRTAMSIYSDAPVVINGGLSPVHEQVEESDGQQRLGEELEERTME